MSATEGYGNQVLLADDTVTASTLAAGPTRTVAIIKHHALQYRFDIETRIAEAGFEIVKERQMEFDVETDPDTLVELFGVDAYSFSEGPVRVLILERANAVEEWKYLMGDADPAIAKEVAPNSIRALYGLSASQNSVMGSVDGENAEVQIASLFASSPPFPVSDLPDTNGAAYNMDTMRSVASDVLSSLASGHNERSSTNGSATNGIAPSASQSNGFRARPVPTSNTVPSIKPRMSRAASLRTGAIRLDDERPAKSAPRAPVSKDRLAQTFADVPGHGFRSQKIQVASTAAPAIAPRMTKAAALRLGLPQEKRAPPRPRASTAPSAPGAMSETDTEIKKGTFDGVPGHKRRESISVSSTKAPTVAPRLNRAASLRSQKSEAAAPPSAFNMRPGAAPSLSRSNSRSSMSGGAARPTASRPSSAAAQRAPPSAFNHRATASIATAQPGRLSVPSMSRSASNNSLNSQTPSERSPLDQPAASVPKPRVVPRPSSINAPTMVPRPNRAASLRAAKMAQTQAGTVKTPARKPLSTF